MVGFDNHNHKSNMLVSSKRRPAEAAARKKRRSCLSTSCYMDLEEQDDRPDKVGG